MKKQIDIIIKIILAATFVLCIILLVVNGASVVNSFYENIIESRAYISISKGLLMTIILTFLSALTAVVFGAILCIMKMSGIPSASAIASVIASVFRGIPAVSLLMILFFSVFTSRDTNALTVAVLGYGLYSGAYVSEIFCNGLLSVDPHETEAARMLGMTGWEAFRYVVLPQAWEHARPVYLDSVISLLQWTSVSSYISIVELTKIVSSLSARTGNAFFCLFLSALLYLGLSWIIRGIFRLSERRHIQAC
jgi:amine acid ABC transporter, permease protein, 3-TM region, His/Glu/Gln/Arg/opine family